MTKLLNINNIDKPTPIYILFISFVIYLFIINYLNIFLNKFITITTLTPETTEVYISFKKILVLLMFASFLEELKYRLVFTKFNLTYLTISFSVILSDTIFLIFRPNFFSLFKQDFYVVFLYYGGISLMTFFLFKILKPIIYSFEDKIKSYYNKNYIRLIFIQLVAFALWHVLFTNQTNNSHFIVVFLIQFLAAFYFTIIRVNYGFFYSVFFHFCANLIGFLPLFI